MADIYDIAEDRQVDNSGVSIHYVVAGPEDAPMVAMIHGFPDFWYTWRAQMEALHNDYRVLAVDLRGYNHSDKPKGVENYTLDFLASDVVAAIKNEGREKATVVGHDWGGAVAWQLAMSNQQLVENLIILNLPHPQGLSRELANSEAQQQASQYAYFFQTPDAHNQLNAEGLVAISQRNSDETTQKRYLEAFQRSDFEAMLNYYKANYPRPGSQFMEDYPQVSAPVLQFHGLKDGALLPGALNDTWQWLESSLTLVTIPDADHWVQNDAAKLVNETMLDWLNRRYAEH